MGLLDKIRGKSEEEIQTEQLDSAIDEVMTKTPDEWAKIKKDCEEMIKVLPKYKEIQDKLVNSDLRKMCIDLIGQAPKDTLFQEDGAQVIFGCQLTIRVCERFFPSETLAIQESYRLLNNCLGRWNPETTTWHFANPPTRDDYDVFLFIFSITIS